MNYRNTINDLENQNKLLKKSIQCRRSTAIIHQYMALHMYKQHYLAEFNTIGEKAQAFFEHLKMVYPGYKDGVLITDLGLKSVDPPTGYLPQTPEEDDENNDNKNNANEYREVDLY